MAEIKVKHEIYIYDTRRGLIGRLLGNLLFFAALGFCIWISQGNAFWTFVTGLLFIISAYGVLQRMTDKRAARLHSFDEVIEWAQKKKKAEALEEA